jgi:hypothetical protein
LLQFSRCWEYQRLVGGFMEEILDCLDEEELLKRFQNLYNNGEYDKCVIYIEKKLSAFSNKFYDIMIVYLNSLINIGEKEKALKLVKEELSMPYIPMNFEDKFLEIYKEIAYIEKEGREYNLSRDKIEEILCVEDDKNLIILAIVELCKLNIRDFFGCIREFFKRDVKNVYKVMLVDAMRGQGVNDEFLLVNKGNEYKVVPSFCENVLESNAYVDIRKIIENKIGTKEINTCSSALENLMLYLSDIYPVNVDESDYETIACALHYYVSKMYDESLEMQYFSSIYGVNESKCASYLKDLESACSI